MMGSSSFGVVTLDWRELKPGSSKARMHELRHCMRQSAPAKQHDKELPGHCYHWQDFAICRRIDSGPSWPWCRCTKKD